MGVKQAIECIKGLNNNERAFLAHCLISSLETRHDEDIEAAWADLAEKRYQELVEGKVEPVFWDTIEKQVRGQ